MPENARYDEQTLQEAAASLEVLGQLAESGGIDLSLLDDSLSKTPWERMLANDDALNFADSLQAAVLRYNAKS